MRAGTVTSSGGPAPRRRRGRGRRPSRASDEGRRRVCLEGPEGWHLPGRVDGDRRDRGVVRRQDSVQIVHGRPVAVQVVHVPEGLQK